MIIYCIVCYFIMFGILLDQHDTLYEVTGIEIFTALFAPIIIPIILGMKINNNE